jgi:hypothetical protein
MELYRTHTTEPKRGTLWENPANGRLYRVTRTKWYAGVGIVHGKAATFADAQADLNDALREFRDRIVDALGLWRFR